MYAEVFKGKVMVIWAFLVAPVAKIMPASAGDPGDIVSFPGLGRFPGTGSGNLLQYSCLENPWTEEPGGLLFVGSQRVRPD